MDAPVNEGLAKQLVHSKLFMGTKTFKCLKIFFAGVETDGAFYKNWSSGGILWLSGIHMLDTGLPVLWKKQMADEFWAHANVQQICNGTLQHDVGSHKDEDLIVCFLKERPES